MAQTDSQNIDLSFLEKKDANALSAKDIIFTVLRNLHWLVLSAVVGFCVAWLVNDRADRLFESHAKIKILGNTPSNLSMYSLDDVLEMRRYRMASNALNDEIIILKSETSMLEVMRRLNLGTSYYYQTKIVKRTKDLYKDSPIEVLLLDQGENDNAALDVILQADSLITLQMADTQPVSGRLGDTLTTRLGRVLVRPTWAYREVYYDTPIQVRHRSLNEVSEWYRDRVSIVRSSDSEGILDLSLNDYAPERAADVLNEIIAVYNENAIRSRQEVIWQTSEYINDRISQLDSELGAEEAKISNFKRDNQILNLEEYGQSYLAASIQSSEEVDRINAQISHATYLKTFTAENSKNVLFPVTVDIDDENIRSTIAEFNTLVLKLDKYKQSGTTNNPLVQNMQLELSTLKSNLNQLLTSYISALQQKIAAVEAVGLKAQEKIRSVPGRQLYLDNISRVQGIKEGLYLTLLTRREELLISQPSIEGKASIVDRARVNPTPISPDSKRNLLMGILLGLLIPVAVFFLRRMLDTKVRFRKDVENYLDIPILGEIPTRPKKDTRDIVIDAKHRDAISEAFRVLRSNMEYTVNADGSATSYLFISLLEGSGKTFLTTNIAASLALVGKRVILLDMDLRKGTLSRRLGLRKHVGFSQYLSGKTDDYQGLVCHDAVVPGVDFIASGSLPPNPAELLSSSRLDTLMSWLRGQYDYILIDAVPAGMVADSTILRRFADVSVFVLRSGRVDKRMLPDIQTIKDREEFPNMVIVLNDVNYKKQSHYGHYGYGYGYGYGHGYGYGYGYGHQYGYGNDNKEPEKEPEKENNE